MTFSPLAHMMVGSEEPQRRRLVVEVPEHRPLVVAPGLLIEPAPTSRGAGWVWQSAGAVSLDSATPAPTSLPFVSNFSRSGTAPDAAYFMVGGDLVTASAAQVLRDLRAELEVTDGENAYTRDLISAANTRTLEFNAALPEGQRSGALPDYPSGEGVVPAGWIQVMIWVVYGSLGVPLSSVRLPQRWTLPQFGQVFAPATGPAAAHLNFDLSALRVNPFSARGDEIFVDGSPGSGESSPGVTGGLIGLGLLGLALALGDRGSK